ncbi:MAG: polysaccharide deacetylase family protein [Candidatus Omnitrophota bacterium]
MKAPAALHKTRILVYHSISSSNTHYVSKPLYMTGPAEFEEQMRYLKDNYAVIGLDEVVRGIREGKSPGRDRAAVTFDDGHADSYSAAIPVLKRYAIPATFFITTGFIGTPGYLTWDELRRMSGEGFGCGCHTVSHRRLTPLAEGEIYDEVSASKAVLEKELSAGIPYFSYPYGELSPGVISAVKRASFEAAFSTVDAPCGPGSDLFAIPRKEVLRQPFHNFTAWLRL